MTTTVVIRSPAPNHEDLVVQLQAVDAAGAWLNAGPPVRLTEGMSVSEYVHGGKRLVITEARRETRAA